MGSFLWLVLTLLCHPLRDLPQALNREQRRFGDSETGVSWPAVVGQAGRDSSMIPVGQANDEVRIWPTAHPNELDALTMQGMMGMGDRDPFQRWFVKGGSVL